MDSSKLSENVSTIFGILFRENGEKSMLFY